LVTATVAEVGRKQPNDNAVVVGLLHHLAGKVEIGRVRRRKISGFREWSQAGACLGRHVAELVLDQVDDDRVKASFLPVLQVAVDVSVTRLNDERPSTVSDDEKRSPILVNK